MNRKGIALLVALITVLLGGLIVTVATMVAATEIRAGTSWSEQQAAAATGASALANRIPDLESAWDSLDPGETHSVDDTVSMTRLGDSTVLISVAARSRLGEDSYALTARVVLDSGGVHRLRVPILPRVRYHPIP